MLPPTPVGEPSSPLPAYGGVIGPLHPLGLQWRHASQLLGHMAFSPLCVFVPKLSSSFKDTDHIGLGHTQMHLNLFRDAEILKNKINQIK